MNALCRFPALTDCHYFDYAATCFMPKNVINAWVNFQQFVGVSTDRGRSGLSREAENARQKSLDRLRQFFTVQDSFQWLFGKNVTEVINVAAMALEHTIEPMDYIVVGPFEHHSNYLPWRYLSKRSDAVFMELPTDRNGTVDLEYLELIADHICVFSYSSVSNSTGYELDIEAVLKRLPEKTIVCCDASQEVAHRRLRVPSRVDVLFLPSHKMYGPKGIAAAAISPRVAEQMQPVFLGGGMVQTVGLDDTWAPGFKRFAAGTQDVGLLCAWAAAAEFIEQLGFASIDQFESEIYGILAGKLAELGMHLILPERHEHSILSFSHPALHAHDVDHLLSERDVVIRSGNLCAQNSVRKLPYDAINRISLGVGIDMQDITALTAALEAAN